MKETNFKDTTHKNFMEELQARFPMLDIVYNMYCVNPYCEEYDEFINCIYIAFKKDATSEQKEQFIKEYGFFKRDEVYNDKAELLKDEEKHELAHHDYDRHGEHTSYDNKIKRDIAEIMKKYYSEYTVNTVSIVSMYEDEVDNFLDATSEYKEDQATLINEITKDLSLMNLETIAMIRRMLNPLTKQYLDTMTLH